MSIRTLALASACLLALSAPGYADTTVTVLHVNENTAAKAIWDQAAADYNAAHKGVTVKFQYLENEAFKAKLPTMLQSEDSRPALFYSWGGGVMDAQVKAGFLKDIKADTADTVKTLSPTAVDAFTVDGKLYGLPFDTDAVPIFYNKTLFAKAGVKPEDMQSWDGFESRGNRPDRRRRWRKVADAFLVLVSGHADRRLACARGREGRQGRRLQESDLR
jgi:raffinose/stachyose/melibiose transport system substrate-binding protein